MSDFYNRLVKAQLDYVTLKKSLASLKWARTKVKELSRMFMGKMSKSADMNSFVKHRSAFVGRISSVIKQIEPNLKFLIDVRILLRSFPDIKDDMMTVSLYGFPNAGKTTILSKLTDSNPKIANYAFTTKTLNLGYMKVGFRKIQIIDTPGTLNRQNKMNSIELQAEVALRTVSDVIVVLLDCSDTYSVADQKELLKRARDTGKEVLIYFSKTDLASEGRIKEFNINERTIDSPEKLGEILKKKLGHFNGALAR